MAIKYTTQGLLIYLAMAAYLLAFFAALARRFFPKPTNRISDIFGKATRGLYTAAFIITVAAFVYRWLNVQHVPMQNLFEVFLCMAVILFPLSLFCRHVLSVETQTVDMAIGAIVLIPAGFVFSAQPQKLPPALQSWLFAPHVAVYMLSYIIMAKATVQAVALLCVNPNEQEKLSNLERDTYRMICMGFPLLTLGLILGSWWGKLAWGDYWGWDPKEMWSLASWLAYVGYLHFRCMYGKRHPRLNSAWAILGMILILLTLFWANLSKIFAGLHSYAV